MASLVDSREQYNGGRQQERETSRVLSLEPKQSTGGNGDTRTGRTRNQRQRLCQPDDYRIPNPHLRDGLVALCVAIGEGHQDAVACQRVYDDRRIAQVGLDP